YDKITDGEGYHPSFQIYNDYIVFSPEYYYYEGYEECPISSLPIGWSGKDNYGRYIMCYGPYDDLIIYDFDTSDEEKRYIVNGYVREKLTQENEDEYYSATEDIDGVEYGERYIEDLDDYVFNPLNDDEITVLIRPKQEKLAAAEKQYDEKVSVSRKLTLRVLVSILMLIISLVYLVIVCGYDPQLCDGKKWRYCIGFGRWHTDILIVCAISTFSLSAIIVADYDLQIVLESLVKINSPYSYWIVSAAAALMGAACLGFSLSIISKIKVHTFWKDFFIIKQLNKLHKRLKNEINSSGLYKKYDNHSVSHKLFVREWIFIVASLLTIIIVTATINRIEYYDDYGTEIYTQVHPVGIAAIIIYAIYLAWFVITQFRIYKDLDALDKQIDSISKGEEISDDIKEGSPAYSNSKKLAEISENIKETVEKQVQSERMKIELVTNVSHDLKTPLTSIISYIDLLKTEELTPEAMDYVKILEQKSEKLKNIVADVFSLAKATSGVDVDMELIDSVILLNQALADAQDKIEKSGKQLKISIEPQSAMIMADGNKLYRVFQNLIDNALNYSMDGTRIFLTMTEENGYVRIEMKNTASYEMTFTPDEITERFTRGDKSRTDGGNGLGLSIAKTFTEACGGVFRVELDGDVFKAVVVLQKVSQPEKENGGETSEEDKKA
ncbi:MAG: sensor histidine kinase, partial [Oscillospiraceae bacterium]